MPHRAPELKPVARLRRLRAPLAAAALSLSAALASVAPSAATTALPETASFGYKFYVGGVLIGKAWLSTRFGADGAYESQGDLETDGVAGWFLAAKVKATSKGDIAAGRLNPTRLEVDGVTEDEPWRMSIAFQGGAPDRVRSEPPFKPKPYEIDPRQQRGALDPISAIVAALAPIRTETPCDRVLDIFDGRKRYHVIIEKERSREVKDGRTRIECGARWKRVGGFKPKMMRKPDVPFTARFELRDGLTVPTKLWGDTEFGGAVAIIRK